MIPRFLRWCLLLFCIAIRVVLRKKVYRAAFCLWRAAEAVGQNVAVAIIVLELFTR